MTDRATQGPAGFEWRVDRFEAIDSTNEEARRRALAGDPGRLWIVADMQTAGRGRKGRTWLSLQGNLHASALLIDPCPQSRSPQLGFVAGVALARAAADLGAGRARIKWPNDLVIGGAKCAGLLIEGASTPERGFACVVGLGVNCETAPKGVGYPTAVLSRDDGGAIPAIDLFGRLAARFEEALDQWAAGENFQSIRSAWLEHAAGVGELVRVADAEGVRSGAFEGLDAGGRLLFRGPRGTETIDAADLWLLPDGISSRDAADGPHAGVDSPQ